MEEREKKIVEELLQERKNSRELRVQLEAARNMITSSSVSSHETISMPHLSQTYLLFRRAIIPLPL